MGDWASWSCLLVLAGQSCGSCALRGREVPRDFGDVGAEWPTQIFIDGSRWYPPCLIRWLPRGEIAGTLSDEAPHPSLYYPYTAICCSECGISLTSDACCSEYSYFVDKSQAKLFGFVMPKTTLRGSSKLETGMAGERSADETTVGSLNRCSLEMPWHLWLSLTYESVSA